MRFINLLYILKSSLYSQRLPEILYAISKCRHYYLRLPEILYTISKCCHYYMRLPEILYAIYKCRLYSVQSRFFCTTIHTHTFAITGFFCHSLRLLLQAVTSPASHINELLVSISHILHFMSFQSMSNANNRIHVIC